MVLNEPNRSFTFGFVIPLLDFTVNSDIDWTKSTIEIDKQLFSKYNFSKNEIDVINNQE